MSYVDSAAADLLAPRARRRRLLRRRLARRPLAILGFAVAVAFALTAIFAPWVAPYSASATDFNALLAHPSSQHLLGTDGLGRDILSRIIWGGRASMQAGVLATLLATAIAVPVGLVAGYYRGWIDPVISRLTDVLLAFPFLILAVGLAAILGPSLLNATIALGVGVTPV
jgi:peptide/nickel transport system permease protein